MAETALKHGRKEPRAERRKSRRVAESTAPRVTRLRLGAFLAATFVVKLIILSQLHTHPMLQPDAGLDTTSYVQLARRVVGGDLALGPGLYYLSPLYIYFLAAVLAVSDSLTVARVLQILLGTAAVGCIFLAAREWFGERAAWIAATLAALTGVFTFHEIVLMQSALDTFLTAAGLWCLTLALGNDPDGKNRHEMRAAGASGILFGLQILNRPNIAVAMIGVMLALIIIRRRRLALLLAAGVAVGVAPVVARNAIVSHQFALSSSQGGLNFFIGNRAGATGQYGAVPGVRANIEGQSEDTRKVAERALGRSLTDNEVSSYFTHLGLAWIRANPVDAAALFIRKLALVFNARHQWLDLSYPYYAFDTGSWLWMLFVGPWLLVPLGLAGVFVVPRGRRAAFFAWAAFMPWYAIGVALFFVAERYRLPLFVPLCVTAGAAINHVTSTFRSTVFAGLVMAGGVLTFWPFQLNDGRFDERLRLSKVLMNHGDFEGARQELTKALTIEPANSVVEFNLGVAEISSRRPAEGIAHLRHSVDLGVPVSGARYALANALISTGDTAAGVRLLRSFTPGPEDDADSCLHVARLAIDANTLDVAERYLARAEELRPGWEEATGLLDVIRRR